LTRGQKRSRPPDPDRTASGCERRGGSAPATESPPASGGTLGNSGEPARSTARRHDSRRSLRRSKAGDARDRSVALGRTHRRRSRRAARRGGRPPAADGGERVRRETGHGNTNARHQGAPHLAAKLGRKGAAGCGCGWAASWALLGCARAKRRRLGCG
jgi:hypothetical protein